MRKSKYTYDLLFPIVQQAISVAGVLRQLGLRPTGGNYRMIASPIRMLDIDVSHFKGSRWAKGETALTHPGIAKSTRGVARTDDEVFVANSPESCGFRLVRRLLRIGWDYHCAVCGISE